ncbi:hypothetical protein TELCIR_04331 [Teladorsagia circumcincta]|uniref:Integrase catalytic domain-containing protein n=1 Tax=Teladorsagia circumcincta TaxID=45464 RepID=A0A2G9UW03_TELCI|nr:hypothetical protein TELCIR_04331 [Teladorsagia circumcincta]
MTISADYVIKHVRSPPLHPQSNGQAERFVDTFKGGLAELKSEGRTPNALQAFLMAYRSTPYPSRPNNPSPAQNFLACQLRIELNLMMPPVDENIEQRDINMYGKAVQ